MINFFLKNLSKLSHCSTNCSSESIVYLFYKRRNPFNLIFEHNFHKSYHHICIQHSALISSFTITNQFSLQPFNCRGQSSSVAATQDITENLEDEIINQLANIPAKISGQYPSEKDQRLLQVGLLGIPNAGKSELTNKLVGKKISAVSSKQNTTVVPALGAYTQGDTQVILHDLPGVLRQRDIKYKGQLARVESAWMTAVDCDVVLFIVDADELVRKIFIEKKQDDAIAAATKVDPEEDKKLSYDKNVSMEDYMRKKQRAAILDEAGMRTTAVFKLTEELRDGVKLQNGEILKYPSPILVLNKIDLVLAENQEKLISLAEEFYAICKFDKCFFISALKGYGLTNLKKFFKKQAKSEEWLLPAGYSSDKSIEDMAIEMIREKLYRRLNKELPYQLHPVLHAFEVKPSGTIFLEVFLYVKNDSVKKIVVGKGGSVVQEYVVAKTIKELERMYKRRVVLLLKVKIKD